jgi:glycosyltransferase involved in cell wall biosynthesis
LKSLKVLHTAEAYWPVTCGVQECVQRISEGLVRRGHKVTVATTYHPERKIKELNGVAIEQFNIIGKWTRGFTGEVRKFKEFLLSFDGDIMLNYAALQWSTDLVLPLLKGLSFKKILLPCGYSTLYNWKWKPYYWLLPKYLRRYDHIIYLSDNYQDKEFGDRHGITHCSTIGNGALDEEFLFPKSGFRKKFGISTPLMFLCVSNYGPLKNQEMVLDAYSKANIPDSTLVFIGTEINDYAKHLISISQHHKLNTIFLDHVPRETVVNAYHEADLFLFGSKTECFPLVIVEAIASATPFISTNVGCVNSLSGGLIVSSVDEMTQAMNKLAQKDDDWKTLSEAGRKAWEDSYRWEKIIDQYEDLYIKLCTK